MTNNCPFYGHHMYLRPAGSGPTPFLLLEQAGNQCAVVIAAFSPCYMEQNGLPIDWRECPLVADLRVPGSSRGLT